MPLEIKLIRKKIVVFFSNYFKGFVLVLTLIIAIAGVFLLYKYKYTVIVANTAEVNEEPKTNERVENIDESEELLKKSRQLTTLKNQYNLVDQKDKDRINKILPEAEKLEILLPQLEVITMENGLLPASIRISEEEGTTLGEAIKGRFPDELKILKINLELMGASYKNLYNLLTALEKNLQLIDITSLNFTPGGNISLELMSYYVKKPTTVKEISNLNINIFSDDRYVSLQDNYHGQDYKTGNRNPFLIEYEQNK